MRDFFEESYLQAGDNFWFFFSGHGIRHQDRDYLMPCDANPRDVEYTAISISYVTERLRRCGADNVVLLLDACRNEGEKAGLGIGEEKQQGVITIYSCSPREKSYEIDQIGQGAFTYALLESLRIQGEGNCATVERLYQRLRYRVAEINRDYNKPEQTPYAIVEPASKYHLILLPRQATLQDIATLREDAQDAELEEDFDLAEQLWTRVLAIYPADSKALKALRRIWGQSGSTLSPQPLKVTNDDGAKRPQSPPTKPSSFDGFVKKIHKNYGYLEDLPPYVADRNWELLNSASAKKFSSFELNILKLSISYCCFFSKGFPTPSPEYRFSSREDYYSVAKQITKEVALRNNNQLKLSSVIKDTTFANIIQSLE